MASLKRTTYPFDLLITIYFLSAPEGLLWLNNINPGRRAEGRGPRAEGRGRRVEGGLRRLGVKRPQPPRACVFMLRSPKYFLTRPCTHGRHGAPSGLTRGCEEGSLTSSVAPSASEGRASTKTEARRPPTALGSGTDQLCLEKEGSGPGGQQNGHEADKDNSPQHSGGCGKRGKEAGGVRK